MQSRQIDLVLNKLLKAQYEGTTPNTDELYLVTDDAGITSADVVNALGYTPYNGTSNPNGYIGSAQLGDATITIQQDSEAQNFTTNQTTNQTINIKGLYDYYNLNEIRVIGSPTINDGVVSDIYANNFVMHSCKFPTSWEFEMTFTVDFTPGEKDDEIQYIIGDGNVSPNLAIRIDGDYAGMTEDSLSVCINGTWYGLSSATLYGGETYQLVLSTYGQADSSHSIGTYLYVYSITSDEVIYDGLVTSNVLPPTASNFLDNIYFGFSNQGTPLDGSIDLTKTYLRTINNGQTTLVWTGAQLIIDTKANTSLTNITDSAKVMISGMGMPSDTYTDLTLGASNATYTAPADGYFVILMNAVNNATMTIGMAAGVSRVGFTTVIPANNNLQGNNFGGFIPVKKGDTASVFYSGTTSAFRFRFVYAVGSESEAN